MFRVHRNGHKFKLHLQSNNFIFFTEFKYVQNEVFDFAGTSSSQRFLCSEIIYAQPAISSFILSKFGVLEGAFQ